MNVPHKQAKVLALPTGWSRIRFSSTLVTLSLVTVPCWAVEQPLAPQAIQTAKAPRAVGLTRPAIARPLATQDVTVTSLKRGVTLQTEAGANATARFTSKLPVGLGGKTIYVENVLVESGHVNAIIPSNGDAGVLLQSKDGVQAISAAGHLSMVVASDHIAVAAIEGPVLAGKSGLFKPLAQGTIRTFSSSGSVDRQRLAAPSLSSIGLSFAVGKHIPVSLQGGTVTGAKSYCGFLFDEAGALVDKSCENVDPSHLTLEAPHAGNFWGTMSAVDEDGFPGTPSELTLIRVLGFADTTHDSKNGVVHLAPGEQVEIVGQQGLLMRYGSSPEFVPATRTIGIHGGQATTVEFRDPKNSGDYVLVNLSPKVLKSKIQIGPIGSTWPEDDISISVQLWDGDGQPLNVLNDYQVLTRVDLDKVDVNFTEKNGKLVGALAPRRGPGPWVIRVSVNDQNGNEVGRDFLEITKTK